MNLALVTPWFGRVLKGGAEQHAWQIAARLTLRGHDVEVLTTCCRSHQDDWTTNHLPAGLTNETEGFRVRRFAVAARDVDRFERASRTLQVVPPEALRPGVAPVSAEDSQVFVDELIRSPDLLTYLGENKTSFDSFLLLPYLYGPVIKGIDLVGERAALVPCLHDEGYAYLPEVADAFARARLLLFNSAGEQELALHLYGPGIWRKSRLVGGGIETAQYRDPVGGPARTGRERFILYLGRKDPGKNVPMLLRAFERFRRVRPNSDLRLLLAGHGDAGLNGSTYATDLGLVSDAEKEALLRECIALFQPSQNESFSRVLMEAWMHGKPVAANARCLATAVAVRHSGGGWTAETEDDWAQLFTEVDRATPAELEDVGGYGQRYALDLADWEKAIDRYETALGEEANRTRSVTTPLDDTRAIHQFLPNFSYGDAISNHAVWIRDELRASGFRSEIYACALDRRIANEAQHFSPEVLRTTDALIYHHSIASEITAHVVQFGGPKCLVYHNITPAKFFEPFWLHHASLVERGRADLPALAPHFELSAGVSEYNARELRAAGFRAPGVLPISVDPARWTIAPDAELMCELQDGRTNLLFVGRLAPNKKQDELVVAFAEYKQVDPEARLILVGKAEENDPYPSHVQNTIRELGLGADAIVTGSIEEAKLAAYWRTGTLFWSMSEHEGFCVPLIEAMWFDVPIIAFRSSAIPETLGDAGVMFTDKSDPAQMAALAHLAVTDSELRRTMIEAQRKQRMKFLPENAAAILQSLVVQLIETKNATAAHLPKLESSLAR